MKSIFFRTLKDRKWSILIYVLAGILFVWMYVALFPTFAEQKEQFNQVLDAYPQSFLEAFGVEDAAAIFNSVENFLAMEHYSLLWPIMAIAFAVSLGGHSIAGEIEKKSIETLLAQPISRTKIFVAKYLSGALLLTVFSATTIYSVIPLAYIYSVDYNLAAHTKMFLLACLFSLAMLSLTTFFSALFNEKSKPYFLSIGLIIIMYALNIVASLKENLKDLRFGSFFYYFDSNSALIENSLSGKSLIIFGGCAILFFILALIIFDKRNITVS